MCPSPNFHIIHQIRILVLINILYHVRIKISIEMEVLFIMEREKIKQIYQKLDIIVREEDIDKIMEDKNKVKEFMRLYKQEEIESMNYILGKPLDNNVFTQFELEAVSKINLFNRKVVEACKNIYEKEFKEVIV